MAENVNGADLFASGGHQWKWDSRDKFAKRLVTAGCQGEASMVVALGGVPGVIEGRDDGAPALLKTSAATKALADTAMDNLEAPIIALRDSGQAVIFEDDQGHGGDYLVVDDYRPAGGRRYGLQGANWVCWQYYRCLVRAC